MLKIGVGVSVRRRAAAELGVAQLKVAAAELGVAQLKVAAVRGLTISL